MSKICSVTGKKANNGYKISHSHKRTKKIQHVNLQKKKVWDQALKRWRTIRLSTRAIKKLSAA